MPFFIFFVFINPRINPFRFNYLSTERFNCSLLLWIDVYINHWVTLTLTCRCGNITDDPVITIFFDNISNSKQSSPSMLTKTITKFPIENLHISHYHQTLKLKVTKNLNGQILTQEYACVQKLYFSQFLLIHLKDFKQF